MNLSDIRVTYSGLIAFVVGMAGVFLGLIFTLIVTRRLSPEEFGIWALVLSVVNYFLISEVIISYWTTREIARGKEIGKTSILSSLAITIVSIPIFIVYFFTIAENNQIDHNIILLSVILLPVNFFSFALTGINLGHKPHATSFGLLVFGILKIPLVVITVIFFDWGVIGVILSFFVALSGKIIIQLYFAMPKLKNQFQFKTMVRWVKLSWLPLFGQIQKYIQLLDVVLYSIITSSVLGIAYYHASFAIAGIVAHASSISYALYPKLLSGKVEGIKKNLTLVFYFSIPLLGISIIFSKPALYALNPFYVDAWPIVIFLSFKIFLSVTRIVPIRVLAGTENVDIEEHTDRSKFIKSVLFKIPLILGTFNLAYLIILVVILSIFSSQVDELELVVWWSIIGLLVDIPLTIAIWKFSLTKIKISIPWKKISKFVAATIIFMVFYSLTSDLILDYDQSIYKFLPSVLIQFVICVGIYLGITYTFDDETRALFKSLKSEIFH
jgi:hypothetical protein